MISPSPASTGPRKSQSKERNAELAADFEAGLVEHVIEVTEEGLREGLSRALKRPPEDFSSGVALEAVSKLEELLKEHTFGAYRSDARSGPLRSSSRACIHPGLPINSTTYVLDGKPVLFMHDPAFEHGVAYVRYSIPRHLLSESELSSRPTSTEHLNAVMEREAGPADLPPPEKIRPTSVKRYLFTRGEPLPSYINARLWPQPQEWPQARRQRSSKEREHIERWAVNAAGRSSPTCDRQVQNRRCTARQALLVPSWGGRKQSKYNPVVEDAKHAIA